MARLLTAMTSESLDLATVVASDFRPFLGSEFAVCDRRDVSVTLVDVISRAGPDRDRPFSIIFRGPASARLDQSTYSLTQASLGVLSIFLVPVAGDAHTVDYEALFN